MGLKSSYLYVLGHDHTRYFHTLNMKLVSVLLSLLASSRRL